MPARLRDEPGEALQEGHGREHQLAALTSGLAASTRAGFIVAGGEDYKLLVAVDEAGARALIAGGFVEIGWIEPGAGVELRGLPPGTELGGHDHFG